MQRAGKKFQTYFSFYKQLRKDGLEDFSSNFLFANIQKG